VSENVERKALDRAMADTDQLVLVYQPIHVATTKEIWGVEALLRQRRENGEIREASIIHETAENSGGDELFRLDSLVIRRAYTEAAQWQSKLSPVRLNINLSPREFQEGNVHDRLSALVTECGIDTRLVNLEITEVSHIKDPRRTRSVLEALKERGVGLWLDDFGVGYSSVSHLQHFPLNGIKLPGDFIRPLPADARCRSITRALIGLAHELGLEVIAEEVETDEQLAFLLDHGCEYVQGFLLSRPLQFAQLEEMLASEG
jgi:EAL domain-containing protein (putative c-di-GMP-specific phosphodiesterase class I)